MHVEIQVALNFLISFLYNKLPRRRVNQFGEELENALKIKFDGHWYPEKPYKGSAFRCLKTTPPLDPAFEMAAREAGMDLIDIQENLPQELSIWIDPGEVSYRMSEKGPVKILYTESDRPIDSENSDREVIRTFNPEAQCFKPIEATTVQFAGLSMSSTGCSPLSPLNTGLSSSNYGNSIASAPLNSPAIVGAVANTGASVSGANVAGGVAPSHMYKPCPAAVNGYHMPKTSIANVTFTTATFAQTKFGSTKLKSNSKRSHRMSPTEFSNYIKQREILQQQQSGNPGTHLNNGMSSPVHGNGTSHGLFANSNSNQSIVANSSPSHQTSRSISPISGSYESILFANTDRNGLLMAGNSSSTAVNSIYSGQSLYSNNVTSSASASASSQNSNGRANAFSPNSMLNSVANNRGHQLTSIPSHARNHSPSMNAYNSDSANLADLIAKDLIKSSSQSLSPSSQLPSSVFRFSSLFSSSNDKQQQQQMSQSAPQTTPISMTNNGNPFDLTNSILSPCASPPPMLSASSPPLSLSPPLSSVLSSCSSAIASVIGENGDNSIATVNVADLSSQSQSLASSLTSNTSKSSSLSCGTNKYNVDGNNNIISINNDDSISSCGDQNANSASSSPSTSEANPNNNSKGFDNLSFNFNGVSHPNQYQHLLVAN